MLQTIDLPIIIILFTHTDTTYTALCAWVVCVCVRLPGSARLSSASESWSSWSLGHSQRGRSSSSFRWTPKHPGRRWSPTYPLSKRRNTKMENIDRDTQTTTRQGYQESIKSAKKKIRGIDVKIVNIKIWDERWRKNGIYKNKIAAVKRSELITGSNSAIWSFTVCLGHLI